MIDSLFSLIKKQNMFMLEKLENIDKNKEN